LESAAQKPAAHQAAPKKTGLVELVKNDSGALQLRVEKMDRNGVAMTLLPWGGGTRAEAELALRKLLEAHWPE